MGGLLGHEPLEDAEEAAEDTPVDGCHSKMVVCAEEVFAKRGGVPLSGHYTCSRKFQQDYTLLDEVLGSGGSGQVRSAVSKASGQKFAVKRLCKSELTPRQRHLLKNEVELYLQLAHPHIVQLKMAYETEEDLHMVMDRMEGGELYDRVAKEARYTESTAAGAMYQILLAVAYLHAKSTAHRDLKLENFMYEHTDSSHLKLIDFGFAHLADASAGMSQVCGSVHYVAPEVLSKSYGVQADMWSVGIIAYMILTGTPLFNGNSNLDVLKRVKAGRVRFCSYFTTLSIEAQSFVSELLVRDPSKRLTAAQALQHPWLRGHDNSSRSTIDRSLLGCVQTFVESSRFRRAVLCRMAWSLSPEEQAGLREQFLRLDLHRRGHIRLSELQGALEECSHRDGTELGAFFPMVDSDSCQDVDIQYSEFLAAALVGRVNEHDELLQRTFAGFEWGSRGPVAVDELRATLAESFASTDVEELVRTLETSGKGHVDYDDLIVYLQTFEPGRKEPEIKESSWVLWDLENNQTYSEDFNAVIDGFLNSAKITVDMSFDLCKLPAPILLGRTEN